MLIRKEHTESDALLGIWRMEESCEELLKMLPEYSRSPAVRHIHSIRSEQRALEWLSTRTMLYAILQEEKEILKRGSGQPYFADQSYNISISHTKNYAAILLHKTSRVGIDIETKSDRIQKIARKFISDNEYIDVSQKTVHQLLHWSAKESLFKLMDAEEIDFREHLHIMPFAPKEKGMMQAKETKSPAHATFGIHYEVHPDIVLTWVCDISP